MIAKVIAYGRDREEALARLRRALRESDRDHRGRHDQPRLPARDRSTAPEFAAGEVDIAWLDRLARRGEMEADARRRRRRCCRPRSSSPTSETAAERARFYAFARRGRPQADAQVSRAGRGPPSRPGLPARRRPARPGPLPRRRRRRSRRGRRSSASSGHERRITIAGATHRTLISAPGRRPARRGRRRAAPHHPRRRRLRAQPRARRWSSRSPSPRATRWPRATSSRSSSR